MPITWFSMIFYLKRPVFPCLVNQVLGLKVMNVFVFEFTEFRPRNHVSMLIATGDVTFSVLLKPEEFSQSRSKENNNSNKNYRWNTLSESYGYFKHSQLHLHFLTTSIFVELSSYLEYFYFNDNFLTNQVSILISLFQLLKFQSYFAMLFLYIFPPVSVGHDQNFKIWIVSLINYFFTPQSCLPEFNLISIYKKAIVIFMAFVTCNNCALRKRSISNAS